MGVRTPIGMIRNIYQLKHTKKHIVGSVFSDILDFGLSQDPLQLVRNLSEGNFATFCTKFPAELYCIYVPGLKLTGGVGVYHKLCNKTEWYVKLNFMDFM